MAGEIIAGLFYIFMLIGSISLGYLVLRFVYPEIRTFDNKQKITTVLVVGIAIILTTFAIDYAISGQRVLILDSFSMPLTFLTTGLYFLVLRTYFLYSSSAKEFTTVGVPIPSSFAMPVEAVEAAVIEEKPRDISKKIAEIKKKIESKRAAEKTTPKEEFKNIEKKISEKVEKEAEVGRAEAEARQLREKLIAAIERGEEKSKESQKLQSRLGELEKQLASEKEAKKQRNAELKKLEVEKLRVKKQLEEELGKKAEVSKQQLEKMQEVKRLEEEKKQLEQKLKEHLDAGEKSKEVEKRKKLEEQKRSELEKREVENRRKRLRESIGESQTYLDKIKSRVDALKDKAPKSVKKRAEKSLEAVRVKEREKLETLKKEAIEKPVEVHLELPTVVPITALPPVAPLPVKEEKIEEKPQEKKVEQKLEVKQGEKKLEKPGFFASLFGSTKKEPKPEFREEKETEFASWRKVKKEELLKKEEKKKLIEKRKEEEKEVDELLKTVTTEAEEESVDESGPVHRRYLLKKQKVKITASEEVAKKEEFGMMMEDIYSKLKTTQKETKVSDVLKVDEPKELTKEKQKDVSEEKTEKMETGKKEQAKQEKTIAQARPEAGVSVSDILGGDLFAPQKLQAETPAQDLFAGGEVPSGGGDIFAQLSRAASGETALQPQEQKEQKSDVSFVQIHEKGVGCPTCHAKNSRIIFCPYCSTGMCANCSPSIKPTGMGQFVYICPKCNEEVTVKKKAA